MKKYVKAALCVLLLLAVACVAVYQLAMDPYRGTISTVEPSLSADTCLSADQIRQDLKKAHRLVRTRHPAWLLEEALAAETDAAFKAALETAEAMTVAELQEVLASCLAVLDDSHTSVVAQSGETAVQAANTNFLELKLDPEHNVGIFALRSCTVNEVYAAALDSFFTGLRREGIENLVLDLRGNGGGNSYVAYLFLEYLDVPQFRVTAPDIRYGWYLKRGGAVVQYNNRRTDAYSGTVYVITDRYTYSSAVNFAELLADNEIAIHVGEAPNALPDSYGDLLCFRLPNSGLQLNVSHKRFYRIDQTQSGQPLEPDYPSADPLATVYELIKMER